MLHDSEKLLTLTDSNIMQEVSLVNASEWTLMEFYHSLWPLSLINDCLQQLKMSIYSSAFFLCLCISYQSAESIFGEETYLKLQRLLNRTLVFKPNCDTGSGYKRRCHLALRMYLTNGRLVFQPCNTQKISHNP